MYHEIPSPLFNRVFTVLVLTTRRSELGSDTSAEKESIVVQLHVDLESFPLHIRERANHSTGEELVYQPHSEDVKSRNRKHVGKKLVVGHYASVEKLTYVPGKPDTDGSQAVGETTWTMSTTSDANGLLPKRLQNWMIPSEIVKDVGYVYDWIGKKRLESGWPLA